MPSEMLVPHRADVIDGVPPPDAVTAAAALLPEHPARSLAPSVVLPGVGVEQLIVNGVDRHDACAVAMNCAREIGRAHV